MTKTKLRKYNRNQVYRMVYQHREIAKSDIASSLGLSLPTISQFVSDLEKEQLISKNGFFESTGGRKPIIFSCVSDAKIAIGIELIKERFQIVAIDLYGTILFHEIHDIPFSDNEAFFCSFGEKVTHFLSANCIPDEKILGVCIAMQGLVSLDGTHITYGAILSNENVTIDRFQKYLDYPLILMHDSEAAALNGLWNMPDLKDAIFLSLSRNIGGALIINHQIHWGSEVPSGLIEHMTLIPDGAPCYCGKKGCLEAYCSVQSLINGLDTHLRDFMTHLREGNPLHQLRWHQFLQHLAIAIDNMQMMLNCEVILSGHLAPYFLPEDLEFLTLLVKKDSAFNNGRPAILLSKNSNIACGAALYYVRAFIDNI